MNQRGFIELPILAYVGVAVVVAFSGMGLYTKHLSNQLEDCRAKYAAFTESVKIAGELAKREAEKKELEGKLAKEKTDAENLKLRSSNADLNRSLRRARADSGSNKLPAASPASSRPDIACLRRADADAAFQRFIEAVAGLMEEGDGRTIDLNSAKRWLATAIERQP